MQVFFPGPALTLILCFILWPLFQGSASLVCLRLGDRFLSWDGFLFRPRRWEREGRLYRRFFKINRWKGLLPDGAAVQKEGFRKKHLAAVSPEYLEKFLRESCRGELSHWLAMLPFWVFGFFMPPVGVLLMFVYAVAVNLPCILAQRYNRPRIHKLLVALQNSNDKTGCR